MGSMVRMKRTLCLEAARLWFFGLPPMHYLTSWRMQVAAQKLCNTSASLAQVAEIVGYDSEAAFSRAFKKAFGVAPATWRRSNS
jgi:AraC-like DNA-binding protein